jgi:hypothetical protein
MGADCDTYHYLVVAKTRERLAVSKQPINRMDVNSFGLFFLFFSVPVCAITALGVPGGTLVSMNRFSTLCGCLVWLIRFNLKKLNEGVVKE